ncbi:MAG: 2-C-methyl-D-erythritol 2,4-cyclodiphosphate synthase [Treponema sp.]|jgi:2-C-methyl-D-erythritol 2,4-cyclodiphosphate synthase/2-C-methyl-D-erythritol 4-phosphate cytidylyltransferase/2-C-methyl-D-erythritol 2,4-cyclodiphosphate synthase|nr:2-C-methyl-D-erythritol 2,4-cyclodiphosphate synthase [Treponema sp.]
MFRIGLGTDLHRLVEGRKLLLGGVPLDFNRGEDGHSDGDVLIHAIIDALLGASALGDIGSFFPPEDDQWKDCDSSLLLKQVISKISSEGWKIENIDCVVKLQAPKFIPYRNKVLENLSEIMGIEKERIFVKAKTGEKLPPVGTSEAVEAECVCLLSR